MLNSFSHWFVVYRLVWFVSNLQVYLSQSYLGASWFTITVLDAIEMLCSLLVPAVGNFVLGICFLYASMLFYVSDCARLFAPHMCCQDMTLSWHVMS